MSLVPRCDLEGFAGISRCSGRSVGGGLGEVAAEVTVTTLIAGAAAGAESSSARMKVPGEGAPLL